MTTTSTREASGEKVLGFRDTGAAAGAVWTVALTRWKPVPSCRPEPYESLRRRLVPMWEGPSAVDLAALRNLTNDVSTPAGGSVVVIAGWAVVVWLASNLGLAAATLETVGVDRGHPVLWQLAESAIWGSLAVVAWVVWRRAGIATRLRRGLVSIGAVAGGFHVALLACAGLVMGFGQSPYSSRPAIVIANIVYFVTILVTIELSRACVLAFLGKRNTTVAVAVATVGFALLVVPAAKFGHLDEWERFGALAGGDVLPALSSGLLASFLALVGGPLPAIAYRGIVEATQWLSPILPNLTWQMSALVGTLAPMIGLWLIQRPVADMTDDAEPATGGSGVMTLATAVLVLWFFAGFAGFQPVAVSGPSMEPTLHVGDLVVVRETDAADITVGDVIRYRTEMGAVIHRVVDVRHERGQLRFVTRGDANNIEDDPVAPAQLEGRVVLTIPKMGWPSIWLRQAVD